MVAAFLLRMLLSAGAKLVFNLVLGDLQKSGKIGPLKATALRAGYDSVAWIEHLKSFPDYNIVKNDPFAHSG
jgi:hypothetical protein